MKETNSNPKIWLSSPHMGGEELSYINSAFADNWIAPLGGNVNGFEEDIATFLDDDVHVAALSTGTAAIHLGLILLGVKKDDEVICQTMTFSASANPILYLGGTPVFVDSEQDTWNMCPESLEKAIQDRIENGKKPKAIIAVHLYGMPYKADEINAIAHKYNIPVLEDSAEALGSEYKGRKCGTLADISILSFNGNKIITTSGGGALITHSKKKRDKAIFYATQSRDDAPHYQHSHIGYNYRLSNISAGIGRGQMEVLKDRVDQRREVFEVYKAALDDIEGIEFIHEPLDYYSNRWLTAILVHPELTGGITNEDIRLHLETKNIESRHLWKPMHLQPIFEDFPYYGIGVAENLFERGLCLPSGSNLTREDLERVITGIMDMLVKEEAL